MNLNRLAPFAFIILAGAVVACKETSHAKPPDLLSWPRMQAAEFGCMLEKQFHVQDGDFNCSSIASNRDWGDACKNTRAYYAGPVLPEDLGEKIDPSIEKLQVAWEHGQLQKLTVKFKGMMSDQDVEALFGLKLAGPYPKNITSIKLQACSKSASCLSLTGFDHMGAGDMDCG